MNKFCNMMFEFRYEGDSPKKFKSVVFDGGHPTDNQLDALYQLFENNKESGFCIVPDAIGLDEPNGHKVASVCTYWKQNKAPTVGITPPKLIKLIEKMNVDFGVQLYNAF